MTSDWLHLPDGSVIRKASIEALFMYDLGGNNGARVGVTIKNRTQNMSFQAREGQVIADILTELKNQLLK